MDSLSWLWEWPMFIPELLPGLALAIVLTALSCVVGYPLGVIFALMTEARNPLVRWIAIVYVEIGRGIPILVLLYLVYRGFPQLGVLLDAFPSAFVAIAISASAYSAEVFRSSLAAVPRGQRDGGNALALTAFDQLVFVLMPQAARISIPPLVNLTITMFHATSLASLITVSEIMHATALAGAITWKYMSVYVAAAFLYAVIAIPGAIAAGRLERRLGGSPVKARNLLRIRRAAAVK